MPPISSVASSVNSSDSWVLALVDEISVGALDPLDLVQVLQPLDAGLERVKLLLGRLRGGGSGDQEQRGDKQAAHHSGLATSSAGCGRSLSDCPVTGWSKLNGGM